MLSKEQIFAAPDLEYRMVAIPEWGGEVRIKVMSIAEQIKFEDLNMKKKDNSELVFAMLSQCCIDEKGDHLFDDEDLKELSKKSSAPILHLFNACLELNTMSKKALDDQVKK